MQLYAVLHQPSCCHGLLLFLLLLFHLIHNVVAELAAFGSIVWDKYAPNMVFRSGV